VLWPSLEEQPNEKSQHPEKHEEKVNYVTQAAQLNFELLEFSARSFVIGNAKEFGHLTVILTS
jgi:hypothetical protein